jgi:uncharacterized protein
MTYYKPSRFLDFHVHVWADEIAPKAIAGLSGVYPGAPLGDGTLTGTLKFMDRAGVDICVPQPVATRASQVRPINDWALSIRSEHVIPFGSMHPDFDDIPGEIDRLLGMGFRGIKLQPGFQDFYPDDPRALPIYEAAQGKLAILFHTGEELEPRLFARGVPARLAEVHRRFPDLTVIAAHMGGFRVWNEAEEHLVGTEVYLDISFCPEEELSDSEMVRLIRKHGAERVLFASDFPMRDPAADAERLTRLDLTPDEKEDIAWRNAARLLGI